MVMPQAGMTILRNTPHGSIVGRRVPVHEDPPVPWYEFASDTSPDFIDGELRHRGTRWPSLSWPNAGMRPLNAPAKEVASYYEKHRGHAGLPRTAWDDTNARVNRIGPSGYRPSADAAPKFRRGRTGALPSQVCDVPAAASLTAPTIDGPHGLGRATPLYRSVMLEVERWRIALNLPMEKFCEYAGLPDRYYPKALGADMPSGRQAHWRSVQIMLDAMMPDGFDLQIVPKRGAVLTADSLKAKLLQLRAPLNPRSQRELMRELGRAGRAKQLSAGRGQQSPAQRSKIARNAARSRWARWRRQRAGAKPMPNEPSAASP